MLYDVLASISVDIVSAAIGAGGIVVGGLIAGAFAWFVAQSTAKTARELAEIAYERDERRREKREERELAVQFMLAMDRRASFSGAHEDALTVEVDIQARQTALQMVCSPAVSAASNDLYDKGRTALSPSPAPKPMKTIADYRAARLNFTNALRVSQGLEPYEL